MRRFFDLSLKFILLAGVVGFISVAPTYAQSSLSQEDQNSIYNDTVWYDPSGTSAACTDPANSSSASGSVSPNAGKGMSASAQQKFQQALVAAGAKFNVNPNFIASFYYAENSRTGDTTNNADSATPPPVTGDGNWREPATPYGSGLPWRTGGSDGASWPDGTQGAHGPFQFEPDTWSTMGVDGNGDGQVDANDLIDATFGAAKYLAYLKATVGANQQQMLKAAFSYNQSTTYGQSVLNTFNYLSGGTQSTVSGSVACPTSGSVSATGYTNPFPGGWIPNRLDMGYDGTFKGQIVAPFAGTITYAANSFSNWGGYLELKANKQPSGLPTSTLYFAEGMLPVVKTGVQVNAGDPIASPAPSPYGNAYNTTPDGSGQIEWGVAVDGSVGIPTDPLAESGVSNPKQMVLDFASWAEQTLGLPPSSNPSNAGYP